MGQGEIKYMFYFYLVLWLIIVAFAFKFDDWFKKRPLFQISKIKLTAGDFKCLVSGGQLTIKSRNQEIHIILEDMGFDMMEFIIAEIDEKKEFYQDREREAL